MNYRRVPPKKILTQDFENQNLFNINYSLFAGYSSFAENAFVTSITPSISFSFRDDENFRSNKTDFINIRYLDINNNQTTAGQTIYGLQFSADYALSKNLTALFYYDHTFSEYAISTAFPQTTIRSGLTLRYNFGN